MILRFTPRSIQDLEAIAGYLRERNPHAARRVRAPILEALQDIAEFPKIGRVQSVEGVRKLAIRSYPYLVYYTVDAEMVIVLTIRHAAQGRDFVDA